VWKSNFDAPRHRRDVVSVTASARWRPLFDFTQVPHSHLLHAPGSHRPQGCR
jgi:hypothetical protein